MIEKVFPRYLEKAGEVYSISWIESHKDICSPAFLGEHSTSMMERKIREEIKRGRDFYIYLSPEPSGIISIFGNEISTLYVLPQMERRGIGSSLLSFAEEKIKTQPYLWCRTDNKKALSFYEKRGYVTIEEKVVSPTLTEAKMIKPSLF